MDGVPGFNGFMGIAPGASYTYTFNIRQSGTYWYHSHSGTQDQSVLGAIVIEPKEPSPVRADRDYVVLLGDITPENSDQVLHNLKADPGYYNYSKRTLLDFFSDVRSEGFGPTLANRADWGEMRMDPTDLADRPDRLCPRDARNTGRAEGRPAGTPPAGASGHGRYGHGAWRS
jgi:FtsP/CotA-like multicopper oxidase with cupredoxin domain